MDITGAAHLFGGEEAMLNDMQYRLERAGIELHFGLADTRGAAWALAHFSQGIAEVGETSQRLATLPVAALRLTEKTSVALQRLGIRCVADLLALPRDACTRRFGRDVMLRLDQAVGAQPEATSPLLDTPHYGVRMTLPEPIGLSADVMAGAERLLGQLCHKLKTHDMGARILQLTLRRVDLASQQVELRLARPLRDASRILPLFQRGIDQIDAGFGIDLLRLEALQVEPLPTEQINHGGPACSNKLDELITRIGNRIGLENVQRFLPADSHIPERSHIIAPAAYSEPAGPWVSLRLRPLRLFPPEMIVGTGPHPPARFHWRRMSCTTGRAIGPERIAPEWWLSDENWRTGIRDYWKVDTRQGRRLWLFYTPQNPGWFIQGEFA